MHSMHDLKGIEKDIFEFVREQWPSSSLDIAEHFGHNLNERDESRRASTKYTYYLKKLVEKELLMCKKAGNTLVVWPLEVEKLRTVQQVLR